MKELNQPRHVGGASAPFSRVWLLGLGLLLWFAVGMRGDMVWGQAVSGAPAEVPVASSPTQPPKSQEAFHEKVVATYDFHPGSLKGDDRQAKLKLLDGFWEMVESDKSGYLPMVRNELARQDNPSFFYCDGGNLLLLNSEATEDWDLVLRGYGHVDMADVDGTTYLKVVHACAVKGLDTTPAALHALSDSTFEAFIKAHAMTLGLGQSMVFMLFPRPEESFVPALLEAIKSENREPQLRALLQLMEVAVTKEANGAIAQVASDAGRPAGARQFARESVDIIGKAKKQPADAATIERLRKDRREALRRISDEALSEFAKITDRLRAGL